MASHNRSPPFFQSRCQRPLQRPHDGCATSAPTSSPTTSTRAAWWSSCSTMRLPESRTASRPRLLADLAPVTPTAVREFMRTDRVTVFARVYQGRGRVLQRAVVTVRILNERDQSVFEKHAQLDVEAFGSGRAADFRDGLPLAR